MISFYTASLSRCAGLGLDDFIDISAAVSAAETCSSVLAIVATIKDILVTQRPMLCTGRKRLRNRDMLWTAY